MIVFKLPLIAAVIAGSVVLFSACNPSDLDVSEVKTGSAEHTVIWTQRAQAMPTTHEAQGCYFTEDLRSEIAVHLSFQASQAVDGYGYSTRHAWKNDGPETTLMQISGKRDRSELVLEIVRHGRSGSAIDSQTWVLRDVSDVSASGADLGLG